MCTTRQVTDVSCHVTGEVQTRSGDGEKVHATVVFDCTSLRQPASVELQPAATLMVGCKP